MIRLIAYSHFLTRIRRQKALSMLKPRFDKSLLRAHYAAGTGVVTAMHTTFDPYDHFGKRQLKTYPFSLSLREINNSLKVTHV